MAEGGVPPARLRREGILARSLHVGLKCAVHGKSEHGGDITATQDSFFLLNVLDRYWRHLRCRRPLAVHVTLGGLLPRHEHIADLFDTRAAGEQTQSEALCSAIDALNQRFGQDTVRFGELPRYRVPYTGAKIAFGRIPVAADFRE